MISWEYSISGIKQAAIHLLTKMQWGVFQLNKGGKVTGVLFFISNERNEEQWCNSFVFPGYLWTAVTSREENIKR